MLLESCRCFGNDTSEWVNKPTINERGLMPICYLVMYFGSQEPGENIYFLLTGSWVHLYPPKTSITAKQRTEQNKLEKKIHLNWTKESEDNDIIYPAVFSFWNTMQSDAWKISGTTVGWTAGGNFGDIIRVLGSFCSFVIFSSKALIALVSSYLPDDEHSFRTMLAWSHTGSLCHLLKEK